MAASGPPYFTTSQCTVCTESYDRGARCPRLLACGHTFCSECLGQLNSNSNSCNDRG
eukprot:m.288446 g.288446  ORF g.288446 m.288446 type:complete len:57 (-) comp22936_c1_seq6:114-284(-)